MDSVHLLTYPPVHLSTCPPVHPSTRLFDSQGEGFIPVERFRTILKEVDEEFTEDELDDIIFEVPIRLCHPRAQSTETIFGAN